MKNLELTDEMFDFFLRTMEAKAKRLLANKPPKELERFVEIGSGLSMDTGEITPEEKVAHLERKQKWELAVTRTEKAIDLLLKLKN